MQKLELTIGGMHCEACVARVRAAVEGLAGVSATNVQVGTAQVTFDEQTCQPRQVLDAVRAAGFELRGFRTAPA